MADKSVVMKKGTWQDFPSHLYGSSIFIPVLYSIVQYDKAHYITVQYIPVMGVIFQIPSRGGKKNQRIYTCGEENKKLVVEC